MSDQFTIVAYFGAFDYLFIVPTYPPRPRTLASAPAAHSRNRRRTVRTRERPTAARSRERATAARGRATPARGCATTARSRKNIDTALPRARQDAHTAASTHTSRVNWLQGWRVAAGGSYAAFYSISRFARDRTEYIRNLSPMDLFGE